MLGLQGLWILAGKGAVALVPALLLGGLLTSVLLILSALGRRVPAAFFWATAAGVLASSLVMGWLQDDPVAVLNSLEPGWPRIAASVPLWLAEAAPTQLAALVTGWAVACATPLVALSLWFRPTQRRFTWATATLLAFTSGMALLALLIGAWLLQARLYTAIGIGIPVLTGAISMLVASVVGAGSREEHYGLLAGRVMVWGLSGLAVILTAIGVPGLRTSDPTLWHNLTPSTDRLMGLTELEPHGAAFTVLALACVLWCGLPLLAGARPALTQRASVASAAATLVIALAIGGVLAAGQPNAHVFDMASGGRMALQSAAARARLPVLRADLDVAPTMASCIIREAQSGWTAGSRFSLWTPVDQLRLGLADPQTAHELDREPGCPVVEEPLDGPLSRAEIPLVAMDGTRAANALTGEAWFFTSGEVHLQLQPRPEIADQLPERAHHLHPIALPFTWEQPPRIPQPPGHTPGTWDVAHAKTLPLTLIEGPYPILIIDGERVRLSEGDLGRDTLRLALSMRSEERRQLVLVPRKTWSVQDLADWCLVARAVEGARCVIRPETPARWAVRTHLPLPW